MSAIDPLRKHPPRPYPPPASGTPSFRSADQARHVFVPNLVALLRDPSFTADCVDFDAKAYYRRRGTHLYSLRPHLELVTQYKGTHQLSAQLLESQPELAALYEEKFGSALIEIWENAYAEKRTGKTGQLLPTGLFTPTAQGKLNFNIIFRHVVKSHMRLAFDQSTRTVPQELLRKNQSAYMAAQLGMDPASHNDPEKEDKKICWYLVFAEYLLRGGLEAIYSGNAYRAFSDPQNFSWAFEYADAQGIPISERNHLHWSDFKQSSMWNDLSPSSPAWKEIDHIIRKHWRVTVYDERRGKINPRLFPDRHGSLLEEIKARVDRPDFMGFADLFNLNGFGGLLVKPEIGGHPGKILILRYPKAFKSRKTGGFLRVHWFKDSRRFANPEEVRSAVLQEIETAGIALKNVPAACNRAWFKKVHLGVLLAQENNPDRTISLLRFFKKFFPERFSDGTWQDADFPAVGTRSPDKPASFRRIKRAKAKPAVQRYGVIGLNSKRFYVPANLIGKTYKRASVDHIIIYKRFVQICGENKRVRYKPSRAVILTAYFEKAKKERKRGIVISNIELIAIDDPRLPNLATLRKIKPLIEEGGVFLHALTLEQQKALVETYNYAKEAGVTRFLASLRK